MHSFGSFSERGPLLLHLSIYCKHTYTSHTVYSLSCRLHLLPSSPYQQSILLPSIYLLLVWGLILCDSLIDLLHLLIIWFIFRIRMCNKIGPTRQEPIPYIHHIHDHEKSTHTSHQSSPFFPLIWTYLVVAQVLHSTSCSLSNHFVTFLATPSKTSEKPRRGRLKGWRWEPGVWMRTKCR